MVLIDQQRPQSESINKETKEDSRKNPRPKTCSQLDAPVIQGESTLVEQKEPIDIKKKLTVLENHGFILGRVIGTDSYGTVKIATSIHHGCEVAVKVVSNVDASADYLKKFLPREIEVVKGLRHPNLIRFLQAIETTHRVYIIMEYAEKGSLLDFIQRESYIDEPRARKWFRQLVDVIDYCHERGVVHRDIKCENLLIDGEYNIKLSDFGYARGHMRCSKNPLSDTFCGTDAYNSPEILNNVPYTPHHSDVWSMGVVLYYMAFGRLPFDDTNLIQLLKQVQSKVVFPSEPQVSSECKALMLKIFTPVKFRIRMKDIKKDLWLQSENTSAILESPKSARSDGKPHKNSLNWKKNGEKKLEKTVYTKNCEKKFDVLNLQAELSKLKFKNEKERHELFTKEYYTKQKRDIALYEADEVVRTIKSRRDTELFELEKKKMKLEIDLLKK